MNFKTIAQKNLIAIMPRLIQCSACKMAHSPQDFSRAEQKKPASVRVCKNPKVCCEPVKVIERQLTDSERADYYEFGRSRVFLEENWDRMYDSD